MHFGCVFSRNNVNVLLVSFNNIGRFATTPKETEIEMKRCPKCNRTYPDDRDTFCQADGTPLVSNQPAAPVQTQAPRVSNAPPAESVDRIKCDWCQGMNPKTALSCWACV